MRILVTGSAGYLGTKFVALLAARGGAEIHGIDVREPADRAPYASFLKGSVADRAAMEEIFRRARPEAACHLAFLVNATHDTRFEEEVAIEGTRLFLEGCARARPSKVLFMSSVAAYGAHEGGDVPLREESAIRGVQGYGYSRLKAKADIMAQGFAGAHPEVATAILRPCLFVGPRTDNTFFDVLRYPLVPQVWDRSGVRDPEFQFIHEDDMAACLLAAIDKAVRGPFNIAAEGTARFSELARMAGKRTLPLPAWLLYPATALLWRLRLVTSPPAQLDFIRYPWIMDASRMRRELFIPRKSSLEAFREFAERRFCRSKVSL